MIIRAYLMKRKYKKALSETNFKKFRKKYSNLLRLYLNGELRKIKLNHVELANVSSDELLLTLSHVLFREFRRFYNPDLSSYEKLNETLDCDTIDHVRTLVYLRDLYNLESMNYKFTDVVIEDSNYYNNICNTLEEDNFFPLIIALFAKYQSLYVTYTLGMDEFEYFGRRVGIFKENFKVNSN